MNKEIKVAGRTTAKAAVKYLEGLKTSIELAKTNFVEASFDIKLSLDSWFTINIEDGNVYWELIVLPETEPQAMKGGEL